MKKQKLLFAAILLIFCSSLFAKADTYTYNFWDEIEKSPDTYRVSHVLYASDLGLDKALKNPSSLFADGNTLYLQTQTITELLFLNILQKRP